MASEQPAKQEVQQPKKPVGGAFGQFMTEKRAELSKEVEGKPVTALMKLASERWGQLSEEEKKPWQEKFDQAKEQYNKDLQVFLDAGGQKSSPKSKGKKAKMAKMMAKKDPAAPKRPAGGAYGRYMAKHREELTKECEGKPVTEISKLGGQRWKALSEEDKQPYEEDYKKAVDEYKKAMENYSPPAAEKPIAAKTTAGKRGAKASNKASKTASNGESTPPAKKARSEGASANKTSGKAARPRGKAAAAAPKTVALDKDVAERAEKVGMSASLLKLAALEEVVASGKGHAEMLKALEDSNGLFHPARRALLGA